MSRKWKYADLDAGTRLDMLKNGNKELFDEEVERTRSIVKARKELGLDTSEQESWMDTVGYNYSLSGAESMGVKPENVSREGYAGLYLGTGSGKSSSGRNNNITSVSEYKNTTGLGNAPISSAKRKVLKAGELAKSAIEERFEEAKEQVRNEFYEKYPFLEESYVNRGADLEGGKLAKARLDLEKKLSEIFDEYDRMKDEELAKSDKKYAGLADKILEYRRNDTAKESLGTIANVLIKQAAADDGFDVSELLKKVPYSVPSAYSEKNDTEKQSVNEVALAEARKAEENEVDTASEEESSSDKSDNEEKNAALYGILERIIKDSKKDGEKLLRILREYVSEGK